MLRFICPDAREPRLLEIEYSAQERAFFKARAAVQLHPALNTSRNPDRVERYYRDINAFFTTFTLDDQQELLRYWSDIHEALLDPATTISRLCERTAQLATTLQLPQRALDFSDGLIDQRGVEIGLLHDPDNRTRLRADHVALTALSLLGKLMLPVLSGVVAELTALPGSRPTIKLTSARGRDAIVYGNEVFAALWSESPPLGAVVEKIRRFVELAAQSCRQQLLAQHDGPPETLPPVDEALYAKLTTELLVRMLLKFCATEPNANVVHFVAVNLHNRTMRIMFDKRAKR